MAARSIVMSSRSSPPVTSSCRSPKVGINEHLANERTFLAWMRTSIAIIGLGFVMAKFSVWLRQFLATLEPAARIPNVGASLPAGAALIVFGAVVAPLAYWRYLTTERAIDQGDYVPARGMLILVTASVVVVSLAVVIYLVATAQSPRGIA